MPDRETLLRAAELMRSLARGMSHGHSLPADDGEGWMSHDLEALADALTALVSRSPVPSDAPSDWRTDELAGDLRARLQTLLAPISSKDIPDSLAALDALCDAVASLSRPSDAAGEDSRKDVEREKLWTLFAMRGGWVEPQAFADDVLNALTGEANRG